MVGLPSTERIGPAPFLAVDHAGAGELLLFLHGIGGNRRNWVAQLPVFAPWFHAVALDARGYGDSDDYEDPLRPVEFAHDVIRVADHFGARRLHLVGLSMGGLVAIRTAEAYPERIATLSLCDTNLGFAETPPERKLAFLETRLAPLRAGATPADIAPAVIETLAGPHISPEARSALLDSLSALHKDSYMKTLEAMSMDTHRFDFGAIRVPTHVVVGEHDPTTPPALSCRLASLIGGASLSVVPRAGHLSNLEEPAAFNAIVLGFLLAERARRATAA